MYTVSQWQRVGPTSCSSNGKPERHIREPLSWCALGGYRACLPVFLDSLWWVSYGAVLLPKASDEFSGTPTKARAYRMILRLLYNTSYRASPWGSLFRLKTEFAFGDDSEMSRG